MNNSVKIFDSEKTLHVLQEIERNPKVTQRGLAQKLEISLGKINFLINALIDKGVIEIKNFKNSKNKLAYMYLLTPAGIKIKFQLTHKFFIWKTQEYEKLKEEIERLTKEAPVILPEKEAV
ncbi:MAG: MarR family EPS-associated transcriptional regulator [Candidatus Omnitrophota bacterium]|nr:MarR family EPS-associated transcriptional regulator [Candidatus Omnitrophota bacterium]